VGHPVVMGKNTWLSIGKPLEGRINIILTHDVSMVIPGCIISDAVASILQDYPNQEVFVIGGADVFRQFIPHADKIYLTKIQQEFEGDTYFPEVNWADWSMVSYELKSTEDSYQMSFEIWEKKRKK
jgi:dihydrofolate reductase